MSKQVGVSIICPECKNQFYPSWLRHLQSAKKRMFYAMLPCIALLIFVDLNGEAPRAPSVNAPQPTYDAAAALDEVMGARSPNAQLPKQSTTPVTAEKGKDALDEMFDRVVGPVNPNAATPARVQQALSGAEGTRPEEEARRVGRAPNAATATKVHRAMEDTVGTKHEKAYDYLALLNWARAANGRAAPAAGKAFEELGEIVIGFSVMAVLAFALLTLLHTAASMYRPWSMLSKPFRMYWFFSACWVFAVTLFVMIFDPYKIGGLSEMGTDQYSHMFSIAFVIPIFIGLSFYVYQRYVK